MPGSNACFVWKMDLRMLMVNIESYGHILLYFCEFRNMKEISNLDLYGPRQWFIVIDKYGPCRWIIVIENTTLINGL